MSEPRGPVRHGTHRSARTRSTARPETSARPETTARPEASAELQAAFTALARRTQLPTGPDARPAEVLRAAGLPLLMAAIMAGSHAVAPVDAAAPPVPSGTPAPVPGADGWTVTPLLTEPPAVPPSRPRRQPRPVAAARAVQAPAQGATVAPPKRATRTPATMSAPAPKSPAPKSPAPKSPAPKSPAPKSPATKSPAPRSTSPAPRSRVTTSAATKAAGAPSSPASSSSPRSTVARSTPPARPAPRGERPRPAAGGATPVTRPTRDYLVQPDDSLLGISRMQHVKLHDLLELNHLHLESVIHPGDRLLLPAAGAPGVTRTAPPAVIAAAEANRAALARRTVPTRHQVQALLVSTARAMRVDPALALGIAYLESGFQQRVVSPANAVGVMQVVPSAGRWASGLVGRPLDLLDAGDNIVAGVALIRAMLRATGNDTQAVAGYYQGLSSVQHHGMFDDTRRYVASVLRLRARFALGA